MEREKDNIVVFGANPDGIGGEIVRQEQKNNRDVYATGSKANKLVDSDHVLEVTNSNGIVAERMLTPDPDVNLKSIESLQAEIKEINPEIVFHCIAGSPGNKPYPADDFKGDTIVKEGKPMEFFTNAEAVCSTSFGQMIQTFGDDIKYAAFSYDPTVNDVRIPGMYPFNSIKAELEKQTNQHPNAQVNVVRLPELITPQASEFEGVDVPVIYRFLKEIVPNIGQNKTWERPFEVLKRIPHFEEISNTIKSTFDDKSFLEKMLDMTNAEITTIVLEKTGLLNPGYLRLIAIVISDFEKPGLVQKSIQAVRESTRSGLINIGVEDLLALDISVDDIVSVIEKAEKIEASDYPRCSQNFFINLGEGRFMVPLHNDVLEIGHFGASPGEMLQKLLSEEGYLDSSQDLWITTFKNPLIPTDIIEKPVVGLNKKGKKTLSIFTSTGKCVAEILCKNSDYEYELHEKEDEDRIEKYNSNPENFLKGILNFNKRSNTWSAEYLVDTLDSETKSFMITENINPENGFKNVTIKTDSGEDVVRIEMGYNGCLERIEDKEFREIDALSQKIPHKPPFNFAGDSVRCAEKRRGNILEGSFNAPTGIANQVDFDLAVPREIAEEAVMQTVCGALMDIKDKKGVFLRTIDYSTINSDVVILPNEKLSFVVNTMEIMGIPKTEFEFYNSKGELISSGSIVAPLA